MVSVMERKKKRKKRTVSTVLLCTLILVLILLLTPVIYMKKNGIHFIHGTITFHIGNIEYPNDTLLLQTESGPYIDPYKTLDLVNSQFHLNLQEGDSVYVFCKIDPHEITPQSIDILYMMKP